MNTETLHQLLTEVAANRRAGAAELAVRAADGLASWGLADPASPARELDPILARVAVLRPSMGPFLRLADAVAREAAAHPEDPGASAARAARAFAADLRASSSRIAAHILASVPGPERVATYSAGSTVREALLGLHRAGHPVAVLLSEAHPGGEGAALAEELAGAGVRVRLVSDAALPGALQDQDALWLGADALVPEGLVHKVGTDPLVRAAGRLAVPVQVLAARAKMLGPGFSEHLAIEDVNTQGGTASGPLFDRTPWPGIDRVVTEDGPIPMARVLEELDALRPCDALARLLEVGS